MTTGYEYRDSLIPPSPAFSEDAIHYKIYLRHGAEEEISAFAFIRTSIWMWRDMKSTTAVGWVLFCMPLGGGLC